MYRETDRRSSITPQFAIRVAVLGGFALIMFGIIFFRLWYLQVLSGDKYRQEANNNQVRNITVQAPRGRIVDVNGQVLVDNRVGYAVEVDPSKLPDIPTPRNAYSAHSRKDQAIYKRLSPVVGMSPKQITQTVSKQFRALQFGKATVKSDVQAPVYMYILENQNNFPGVSVEQVFLRVYPKHDTGGQLFGTVGRITSDELKMKAYHGVQQNDRVGQSGIESSYDRYLRGADGADQVQVDSSGTLRGELSVKQPQVGHQLRLTVDQNVEQAGQNAMQGQNGAFVVMDVHTGAVVALGSSPTFDPNILSNGISQSKYDQLTSESNGAPLDNRAIQGLYPTGSTFKLITATAGLQSGVFTPSTVIEDPGSIKIGDIVFKDDNGAGAGAVALPEALKVSSDVFFYTLGMQMNTAGDGHDLQRWAHKLGLGQPTGVDLPAENPGLIPSPEWRNRLFKKEMKKDPNCETDTVGCRPWSVGDNVNLAVGQGDVEVTPLQLATAYAALANGGTVLRPHLGDAVEDSTGRVLQQLSFPPMRRVTIDPQNRQAILDGLHMAAQSPGGTSDPVFQNFPIPMAGKTGTAQRASGTPQSWYAALAPYPNPKYVAVATFETGGYGVQTAAPAVEKILARLFNVHLKPGQASNSTPSGVNLFG